MAPPRVNPFLFAQFIATIDRLSAERAGAPKIVDRLLRDNPRQFWPSLTGHPDIRTAGALGHLALLVTEHLNRDAQYSLSLAELAAGAAAGLPDHAYPAVLRAQLRAHALKNLGKVQRQLARYDDAIAAFSQAEGLLQEHHVLHYEIAVVRLHLAYTYQEVDRFSEALALMRECKEVFLESGDTHMVFITGMTEATLLQRLAKYREAREAYLLLLVTGTPAAESVAALRKALGLCCIELQDFATAEANLVESARIYTALGQPLEALRAEAAHGRLLIRIGEIERAITRLEPVRRGFLRQGMHEEAGICALEIVEGFLSQNKPEDAEHLARRVIEEFTRAKLNKRAIIALGYLSRAIAAKRASVPLVHNVRDYILSLRTNPKREFPGRTATASARGSEQ